MTAPPPVKFPTLPPRTPGNPLTDAMYRIADALQYPVDTRGRVYDCSFLLPILAYHLARAGADIDPQRAIIKSRRLPPAPGVIDGAIEWVGVNQPDRIEDELAGATIDDIDRLSPAARAELIRRLGGDATTAAQPDDSDLDGRSPWHVETTIHFDDEES